MDNENLVILDVEVTSPSGTEEAVSSVDMVQRSIFRYDFNTEDVRADSAYSGGRQSVVSWRRE